MINLSGLKLLADRLKIDGITSAKEFEAVGALFKGIDPDTRCCLYLSRGAYFESMDSANLLRTFLMGNMNQYSIITDPTCLKVFACFWPDGLSGPQFTGEAWSEDNAARAWAQATIQAKINHLEGNEVT